MKAPLPESGNRAVDGELASRLARLIRDQFGFVWRLLRRIGSTEAEAELAVLEVFAAAGERIGDIRPSSARSFLFSKALHVAARIRRERPEQVEGAVISDRAPALEDLDEQAQSRAILGALLEQMPLELRVVFVLHEIEQLPSEEIASIIGIPTSMVATRLAEAHDDFATHLESDSEMSQSLFIAAREEAVPLEARLRALRAAGVDELELEASAQSSPGSLPIRRSAPRSVLPRAATWLVLGLLAGFLIAWIGFAVHDAFVLEQYRANAGR